MVEIRGVSGFSLKSSCQEKVHSKARIAKHPTWLRAAQREEAQSKQRKRKGRLPGQGTFLPHIAGHKARQRTCLNYRYSRIV